MVIEDRSFRRLPPAWKGMYLNKEFAFFWSAIVLHQTLLEPVFPFILPTSIPKVSKLRVPHLPHFGKNKHLRLKQGFPTLAAHWNHLGNLKNTDAWVS